MIGQPVDASRGHTEDGGGRHRRDPLVGHVHDHVEDGAEPIHERGCVGLSLAYVRLDRWTALCEPCAAREGIVVVACPCPPVPLMESAEA